MSIFVRRGFFVLLAGAKTAVTVGQACLTVETTVLTVSCLANNQSVSSLGSIANASSTFFQVVAAFFSINVVAMTRFPSIWKNLSKQSLQHQWNTLRGAARGGSCLHSSLLCFVGVMGLLSCISRGLSAYLAMEVLLVDRWQINENIVAFFADLAAITITLTAMCFNGANMLANAAHFFKKPSFQVRPSLVFSMIATLSVAVATRFFVSHFFKRHSSYASIDVLTQVLFTTAEFVLGCFTMVSSFEKNWQRRAKVTLKHSPIFTFLLVGDALTAWLGYHWITWYAILNDSTLQHECRAETQTSILALRWSFVLFAAAVGVPTTLSYIHYLLSYAKEGFNAAIDCLPHSFQSHRFQMFKPVFSRLHELPHPDERHTIYPILKNLS